MRTRQGVTVLLGILIKALEEGDLEDADFKPGGFGLELLNSCGTVPLEEQ